MSPLTLRSALSAFAAMLSLACSNAIAPCEREPLSILRSIDVPFPPPATGVTPLATFTLDQALVSVSGRSACKQASSVVRLQNTNRDGQRNSFDYELTLTLGDWSWTTSGGIQHINPGQVVALGVISSDTIPVDAAAVRVVITNYTGDAIALSR